MELQREPAIEPNTFKVAPTLGEFANSNQMSENQVWDWIEEGVVSARFLNDNIFILREFNSEDVLCNKVDLCLSSDKNAYIEKSIVPHSPPLNDDHTTFPREKSDQVNDIKKVCEQYLESTKNSMTQVNTVYEDLLKTKDDLIRLKNDKIRDLEKKIIELESQSKQMKRELENFATLHKISRNIELFSVSKKQE